jgi:NTE family protein
MTSVGLVLGAGGIVGGAYHAGALAALAETGWDPRTADIVIGTSAGSLIGAALRAGLSAEDQFARMTDRALSPEGERLIGAVAPIAHQLPVRGLPRRLPVPVAPAMAASALLPPWNARPLAALAGLLPAGSMPTAMIGDRVRTMLGDAWPTKPLWVCALRLRDGARVVFGRDDVETPDVGTAVEASSAIPGFLVPVGVGDDCFVDGGAHSPSNADLAADLALDLVVVISPMSAPWTAFRPVPSIGSRALASWVLDREVRAIRASGSEVLVLQPTADDLRVMGHSSMDATRGAAVAEQARATTTQRLEHPAATELVARLVSSHA